MKAERSRQMIEVLLCCMEDATDDSRSLDELTDLCREHGWTPGKGSLYSWLEQGFTRGAEPFAPMPLIDELQGEEPPYATAPDPSVRLPDMSEAELEAELEHPEQDAITAENEEVGNDD